MMKLIEEWPFGTTDGCYKERAELGTGPWTTIIYYNHMNRIPKKIQYYM